jgi:hypothetical protein
MTDAEKQKLRAYIDQVGRDKVKPELLRELEKASEECGWMEGLNSPCNRGTMGCPWEHRS